MSRYLEHLTRATATVADKNSPHQPHQHHHHYHQQQQQQQPARNKKAQPGVFECLCEVIANDAEQPEVAEELRTELQAERGALAVDEHVRKEV